MLILRGNEKIKAEFNAENLNISFNSKYLIDIASEVDDENDNESKRFRISSFD